MELYIYDTNINLLGIIDTANAVIWNRRYFSSGNFEIHLPANEIELSLIKKQRYITKSDSLEFGIIEDFTIVQLGEGESIKVVGRFGSSLLSRRIILNKTTLNTTVEQAMRTLVYNNAILGADELLFSNDLLFDENLLFSSGTSVRKIPKLELGTLNGFTETVSFQVTYKNLLAKLSELAITSGISFRVRLDPIEKKLLFETYKATDRSINQSDNPRVIFSQDYENLHSSTYHTSDIEHSNVAIVAGEGEGVERKIVIVGNASGIDRKEVFINAKDIRTEEGMSDEEYYALLIQAGHESLIPMIEYFEGSVIPNRNATYKLDFNLGDIITIENTKWNKRITVRINEITEVYDENGETIIPVFGEPLPTLNDQLSKSASDTSGSTSLTSNKVVVSDNTGKLIASQVTDTELNYLSGVSSPIQDQLNGKTTIESGSNSNGNYIKFSDGTMICWINMTVTNQAINNAYGVLYQGSRTWTFPVAFIERPTVACSEFQYDTSASWGAIDGQPSTTSVNLRGIDAFTRPGGAECKISAIAIGRWKL